MKVAVYHTSCSFALLPEIDIIKVSGAPWRIMLAWCTLNIDVQF